MINLPPKVYISNILKFYYTQNNRCSSINIFVYWWKWKQIFCFSRILYHIRQLFEFFAQHIEDIRFLRWSYYVPRESVISFLLQKLWRCNRSEYTKPQKEKKIPDYSANNPTCVLNVIIAALGESLFIYTLWSAFHWHLKVIQGQFRSISPDTKKFVPQNHLVRLKIALSNALNGPAPQKLLVMSADFFPIPLFFTKGKM